MRRSRITLIVGAVTAVMLSSMAYLAVAEGSSQAASDTRGALLPLNNSGADGDAEVAVDARRLHVHIVARNLAEGLPHAMHIHWGRQARNECPDVGRDNSDSDIRLTTVEGLPAYGPVRVSLTTRGDTSPASILAVGRFPTAPRGVIRYERRMGTELKVARAIARGDAVVVIHGVDYNGNGAYDFASAGRSELDPALPAEATDPAMCGVLTPTRRTA